jgi:hypothetical protein
MHIQNIIFVSIILLLLIGILWLSVNAGKRYGQKQLARLGGGKLEVVVVVEGAVFTLLALLVAFTFSGAYERFEIRKLHIIEEANAVNTAYKRIDLVAPDFQPALRASFRDYVDAQLQFYKDAGKVLLFKRDLSNSLQLEDKLWQQVLAASKGTQDPSGAVAQLFIPAVNAMFDTETAGMELSRIHPPVAIFLLLLSLAILSGFLAGYSTAESQSQNPLHILSYVGITALTIFIILNLEFPRIGFIRVASFDQILTDVRKQME